MTRTDGKGRVLRTTELITDDLKALFSKHDKGWDKGFIGELAAYVLARMDDEYYRAVRFGMDIGKKEAGK